ncbi:hypothetical protein SAMN05216352_109228 [Alteribacillus bidgolensis]|uniref:Uncharacterized protein n=1 Tax=Alteribacillus bidgolensis TaxID=930129 RepID=A0A1G8M6G1_9BACI|nr:hypothetical protein SAMN05216352_109228 [Alteribacillus bidgolensis]
MELRLVMEIDWKKELYMRLGKAAHPTPDRSLIRINPPYKVAESGSLKTGEYLVLDGE